MTMQLVDIAGYSFSGKSALYEYVAQLPGFHGFGVEFEFDLIRAPGGLLDLRHSLVFDWSLPRSSNAIQNFMRLTYFLGGTRSIFDRLTRGGARYGEYFPDFDGATQEFVSELISAEWTGYWPFSEYLTSPFLIPFVKVLNRIRSNNKKVFLSRPSDSEFESLCQHYLSRLIASATPPKKRTVITSNAFDPSSPGPFMALVESSKCIVVDRDPRDIYLSAMTANDAKVGRVAVGNDVKSFVRRFIAVRMPRSDAGDRVLRIFFEDFALRKESVIQRLHRFLEIPDELSGLALLTEENTSQKNVGMWRDNRLRDLYKDDIGYIERNLEAFLIDKRET